MAFFENLTASLKQIWLPYYQENRAWISRQMAADSVETPDGGRRPSSYLILGVISALEPELADLMLPFTKLNPDVDVLIDVLELNFDPEVNQNNNFNSATNPPGERLEGLLDTANEVVLVAPGEDTVIVINTTEDEFSDLSPGEDTVIVMDATEDEFSDLSLDENEMMSEESNQEEYLTTPSNTYSESGDLLSDQWQQENNSESGQAQNEIPPGENKQSEEDEIARLFPNF